MALLVNPPKWTAKVLPPVGIVAGVYLMAAPALWGYVGTQAEMSQRVCGPVLAIFWTVAMWEATRAVRWWTLPFAAWLVVGPLFLEGPASAKVSSVVVGAAGLALCWLTHPGDIGEHYGGGWRALWKDDPYGVRGRRARDEVKEAT